MPVPEQSGTKHFKRPSEYSVDHTAIPGVVKMPEVKIASDVKPASADKIAAKNEVHPQAGKDPAPRKVAPAPAKAPATAAAAKPAVKAAAGELVITSPLPGVIKEINVKEGQAVKAADVVCILEAMKMGNEIHAGKDGTVKSINVAKEDSVLEGTVIMVIA